MDDLCGCVLNLKAGASPIRWLGPGKPGDTDWALQDGIIHGWSESNMCYEHAWWLNDDGTPKQGSTLNGQNHIDALCRTRPFNPEWLKETTDAA